MKKLYKIRSEAVVGGVCAGIAEYFNIDNPVINFELFPNARKMVIYDNGKCILRYSFLYCLYDGYA